MTNDHGARYTNKIVCELDGIDMCENSFLLELHSNQQKNILFAICAFEITENGVKVRVQAAVENMKTKTHN